jgi:hypothetical protein
MHRFFGWPNRGGRLTILNCLLWLVVAIGVWTNLTPLLMLAIFAWWPVAWLFVLPTMGGMSKSNIVVACVAIGVNSFMWGYGIWGIETLFAMRRQRKKIVPRGFDCIVEAPHRSPGDQTRGDGPDEERTIPEQEN